VVGEEDGLQRLSSSRGLSAAVQRRRPESGLPVIHSQLASRSDPHAALLPSAF